MVPISEALVSAVVEPGDVVLDVACGTGIATRLAAAAVGSSGRVVGSDLNQGMIAYSRQVSAVDWPEILWEEASAQDLPFEDDSFDCAICQQGLQFFPDPAAGLAEMGRVARRGGSVAVTVWSELTTSPYFEALTEMLIDHALVEPDDLVFTATADEIVEWFKQASLAVPIVEMVETEVKLPPIGEYLPSHMKALPWADSYFGLDEQSQQAAVEHVKGRLAGYQTRAGLRVPFGSYVAHTTA
jgi:ubiquinone/menaquinone biosynthesis C-methylase UbiE